MSGTIEGLAACFAGLADPHESTRRAQVRLSVDRHPGNRGLRGEAPSQESHH
jgi:hypothetical protein